MITFNTAEFMQSPINAEELVLLMTIRAKEYKYLEDSEEVLNSLLNQAILAKIKGKASDKEYEKYRLSAKGKEVLEKIFTPPITEEAVQATEALCDIYRMYGFEEKIKGSKRSLQKLVAWFIAASGKDVNEILQVVDYYCISTEPKFVSLLANLIWKRDNIFETKPKLEQSKLFSLMERK